MYEVLKFTLSLGLKKVEVNVDSITVVHSIDKESLSMREILKLISQIQNLMGKLEEVRVYHFFKEENKCVDALANVSCSMGHIDSTPDILLSLLDVDVRGIPAARMMCV